MITRRSVGPSSRAEIMLGGPGENGMVVCMCWGGGGICCMCWGGGGWDWWEENTRRRNREENTNENHHSYILVKSTETQELCPNLTLQEHCILFWKLQHKKCCVLPFCTNRKWHNQCPDRCQSNPLLPFGNIIQERKTLTFRGKDKRHYFTQETAYM